VYPMKTVTDVGAAVIVRELLRISSTYNPG
jgi:hypothetical protein